MQPYKIIGVLPTTVRILQKRRKQTVFRTHGVARRGQNATLSPHANHGSGTCTVTKDDGTTIITPTRRTQTACEDTTLNSLDSITSSTWDNTCSDGVEEVKKSVRSATRGDTAPTARTKQKRSVKCATHGGTARTKARTTESPHAWQRLISTDARAAVLRRTRNVA